MQTLEYYQNTCIKVFNGFIYEVLLHKYWSNGYCLMGHKFYQTTKELQIKSKYEYHDDYFIEKEIILVAAPIEYLKEQNFSSIKPAKKKIKKK